MFTVMKHHQTIVEYLDEMNLRDFDTTTGAEPLSRKARDNALHLLVRRFDLAIGMSVEVMHTGGVRMDILRNGAEYVIEINDDGVSSVVSGPTVDRNSFGMSHSSVNQLFLSKLEKEIPSPGVDDTLWDNNLPLPGIITNEASKGVCHMEVSAMNRKYICLPVVSPKFGFNFLCINADKDDSYGMRHLDEKIEDTIKSGHKIHIGRRFKTTKHLSLHNIVECPDDILSGGSRIGGYPLSEMRNHILARSIAA